MTEPAVFVSNANSLRNVPGGQQICTQEYLRTVEAAGFKPKVLDFTFRRDLPSRVRRKIRPNLYRNALPDGLAERVASTLKSIGGKWVFLNLTELSPIAEEIKKLVPGAKVALLSHGAETVDHVHSLRIDSQRNDNRPASLRRRLYVADLLVDESHSRPHFDHVFTLAPFEAEVERWLGARNATWLPRQIPNAALDWKPVQGRVGFVATLDHWPTIEAMDLTFPKFAERFKDPIRLRLVGGPQKEGREVAEKYPFIDFLGALSDDELRKEAATWTCYPQPLYCFARGCSTKLSTAMSWRIPVVSTPSGVRGYDWKSGGLLLCQTADEVAETTVRLALDDEFRRKAQREISLAAESSPTMDEVAAIMRRALERS